MKNKLKLFGNLNRARSAKVPLLIIALVAVIGFGLIGCSSDGGNDNKPLFSVSGEFKGAGSGNALFKAATAETVSRSEQETQVTSLPGNLKTVICFSV